MIKSTLDKLKKINFTNIQKSFENILPYLIPEGWASHRKKYILFWIISAFTISFFIWSSIAQVNQVVKASGVIIPDSKVHIIQSSIDGQIEDISVAMGDKVNQGDTMFLIDYKNLSKLKELAKNELETRKRKVEILSSLVNKGSDSEFRLLDERLQLIESQKRYDVTVRQFEFASVKATVTGTVSKVDAVNLGQHIQQGNLLAEIVPENDKLKIRGQVNPKDIAYVKVNQKASVGFSAYDQAVFGKMEGIVTKVAANTTQERGDEMPFYPIIIEISEEELERAAKIKLQPGMITDVSIIGQERTVISYLLNPITKLTQEALQE
tara:strand:- start:1228 stop:2196 length:969 start_codon:yes stop_codon:yes gene_type:complete